MLHGVSKKSSDFQFGDSDSDCECIIENIRGDVADFLRRKVSENNIV